MRIQDAGWSDPRGLGLTEVGSSESSQDAALQRSSISNFSLRLLLSSALINASVVPAFADSLPQGGSVAAGSVSISTPSATQMNINQSSHNAVVNWNSFNVGQGAPSTFSSEFVVGASQSRHGLDDVHDRRPDQRQCQVYLVNPNGITITKSGSVKAGGGFVASSLGISDSDFMAGKRTFKGEGAPVTNHGKISVGRGGYAALIGSEVSNTGTISVPMGKVGLGSGQQATLDLSGDGFLQVGGACEDTARSRTRGEFVPMAARSKCGLRRRAMRHAMSSTCRVRSRRGASAGVRDAWCSAAVAVASG